LDFFKESTVSDSNTEPLWIILNWREIWMLERSIFGLIPYQSLRILMQFEGWKRLWNYIWFEVLWNPFSSAQMKMAWSFPPYLSLLFSFLIVAWLKRNERHIHRIYTNKIYSARTQKKEKKALSQWIYIISNSCS
jgi:hypothetical protein